MKSVIKILIVSTVLFSCKSKEEKKADSIIKKISNTEMYNTGTTSCKIDGVAAEIHSQGIMTNSTTGMQSCICDNDDYQVQIIFPSTLAEGQSSSNCKGMVMTKNPMELYQNAVSNTVTITKRNNKIVAGTFAFEVSTYKGSKKIVKVTEGKFEAEILN